MREGSRAPVNTSGTVLERYMYGSCSNLQGPGMQRGKRWLLIAAAILYQCLLLGALAGTLVFAMVDLANGPVRLSVPFSRVNVETLAAVHVGGLVLWALVLLFLAREWRRREHLKEHQVLIRFIVLSLPVYGLIRLLRMCRSLSDG